MNRVWKKTVKRSATITDTTYMAYDTGSNLKTFRDEDSNDYTYLYDASNRRTKMTYPDTSKHEDTSYDDVGNVKTYTNRSGAIQSFTSASPLSYDNRNRQRYFTWNDGTSSVTTTPDAASRITQITNSVSTINYTYLDDNRLSTEEEWTSANGDNVHRTKTYTYDVDGNRATIQYPSGSTFNYTYTNRNQVSAIRSGTNAIVSYGFDPSGNITSRTLDNGTSTTYTPNAVNLDTRIAHALAGTTKSFDYAYNPVNDITAVQRDNSGSGDGYVYDYTHQITSYQQNGAVNLSAGTVSGATTTNNMQFDGCGNRTMLNATSQTFNNMNQLSTVAGVTEYDPKGNLQKYDGWSYTYDAQNRLTNASKGTSTAAFYYDGRNRQIARLINGTWTYSVWDDWELIEEYNPGNVISTKYLQGAHGPIKNLITNKYYYQDSLGSTTHLASSTGALLESYRYDLNGKPTYWDAGGQPIGASAHDIRDLFTGERYIPELGLYDLRNRFYSPALGRFLQPDPIGFKGDASNLYRYCGNDWANKTDPMGLVGPDPVPAAGAYQSPDRKTRLEATAHAKELAGLSSTYERAQLSAMGANGSAQGVTVTGQLQGPRSGDYYKTAPEGPKGFRDSPTSVTINGQEFNVKKERAEVTLQVNAPHGRITEKIYSQESITNDPKQTFLYNAQGKRLGVGVNNTNADFIAGRSGKILDYAGKDARSPIPPHSSGYIVNKQGRYNIGLGDFTYRGVKGSFEHRISVADGHVVWAEIVDH